MKLNFIPAFVNWRLGSQLIVTFAAATILIALFFGEQATIREISSQREAKEREYKQLLEAVSVSARDAILSEDSAVLRRMTTALVEKDQNIVFATVLNDEKAPLVTIGKPISLEGKPQHIWFIEEEIFIDKVYQGEVQIQVDLSYAMRPIRERARESQAWLSALLLLLGAVLVIGSYVLAIRPISEISSRVVALGQGDYRTDFQVRASKELAGLASSLNTVALQLFEKRQAESTRKQQLEKRVNERTKELAVAVEQLQDAQKVTAGLLIQSKKQAKELAESLARETTLVDFLNNSNQNLSDAMKLKDEFLANMSHELRTPLNAVLGLTEAIGAGIYGDINELQTKALKTVGSSGRHLLTLINEILDLSKIEAGKMPNNIEPTDIPGLCRIICDSLKTSIDTKNLDFSYSITIKENNLDVDPLRLRQAIINLMGNAIKFTPESAALGLEVKETSDKQSMQFKVWDQGPGIPEEQHTALFEPFVQLDGGLARKHEGTGLGLAIVKKMANAFGWTVYLESELGVGTAFYIEIPFLKRNADKIATVESNSGDRVNLALKGSSKKVRVVIVDDNLANLRFLQDVLESQGHEIFAFDDAKSALAAILEKSCDLVVTDIQMPGMSGLELIGEIRDHTKGKEIKIVALTALARDEDKEACLEAGADGVLTKPVSLEALESLIT